jgi:multiple sugar transport system substrate-binding protein
MNFNRNQIIILGGALIFIIIIVLIFIGVLPGLKRQSEQAKSITLSIFGLSEEKDFKELIEGYTKLRPNVKILYTQFSEENFEDKFLDVLASGNAPDIIFFHSSWLPKHIDKIIPAPNNQIAFSQFAQLFPEVVVQNFAKEQKIYALPLFIDTLAMLYNKDLIDAGGVAVLPKTWAEFQSIIPKLRTLDAGKIIRPAAAIGGSRKSIETASDLLNLMIMQSGGPIVNQQGAVVFGKESLDAFDFYLSFANPNNDYYTWNDNLGSALEKFSQGEIPIIFNYYSSIAAIKDRNTFLNLGVAPVPQLSENTQPIAVANYWGLAVTKQSRYPEWAWDFLINTIANQQLMEVYLQSSNQLPALRSLISQYLDDIQRGVFARQALIARAWPSPDKFSLDNIFSQTIDAVLTGRLNQYQSLRQAESTINNLLLKKNY